MKFAYVTLKARLKRKGFLALLTRKTFLAMNRNFVIHLFIPAMEELTANLAMKILGSGQVFFNEMFIWEFFPAMNAGKRFVIGMSGIGVKIQFLVTAESHVTMFTGEFLLFLVNSLDVFM